MSKYEFERTLSMNSEYPLGIQDLQCIHDGKRYLSLFHFIDAIPCFSFRSDLFTSSSCRSNVKHTPLVP